MADDGPTLFDAVPLAEPLEARHGPINPRTLARTGDPETSLEAARLHVSRGSNARQAAAVLAGVQAHPGLTSAELAERTGLGRHVTGRRLPELERRKLVRRGEVRLSTVGGRRGVTWWPL